MKKGKMFMYEGKNELLDNLEFGNVDSESETDLDSKFIRTQDFNSFLNPQKALILGAKGSGKSALFQMFARYEESARKLSGLKKNKVLIVTGTGFNDIKELREYSGRFYTSIPEIGNRRSDVKETALPF